MRYEMIVEVKSGRLGFDLVKYESDDDFFGDDVIISADNRGCSWDYILRAIVAFDVQNVKVYEHADHCERYPDRYNPGE